MKTKILSTTLSSVFLASALALAGCSGTGQESTSTAPASAAAQSAGGTVAPVAVNTHGRVKMVGDALSQVSLRPDQRTAIEKLASDAETRHAAQQKAHLDVANMLADQVQAGTIDRAALQTKIDAAVAAAEATRPQDRAAFQQLHDLLDASQREAFVTALEANMQAHHHRGAKAAAPATGDATEADGQQQDGHPFGGHLQKVAAELGLSSDQVSQIKDIMHAEWQKNGHSMRDFAAMKDHASSVMDQFKQDSFSLDQAAPPVDLKSKVSEGSTKMLDVTEKVLPLLSASQRALAAQKIREHGAGGKMMPF